MRASDICVLGIIVEDSVILPPELSNINVLRRAHALRLAHALRHAHALRLASAVLDSVDDERPRDIQSELNQSRRSRFKGPTRTGVG